MRHPGTQFKGDTSIPCHAKKKACERLNGLVSAILPAVDGGKGHLELTRELFLGEPASLANLSHQSWVIHSRVHCTPYLVTGPA
jgi:hypothetical protein